MLHIGLDGFVLIHRWLGWIDLMYDPPIRIHRKKEKKIAAAGAAVVEDVAASYA